MEFLECYLYGDFYRYRPIHTSRCWHTRKTACKQCILWRIPDVRENTYTQHLLGQAFCRQLCVLLLFLKKVTYMYMYLNVRKYYKWKGDAVESKLKNKIMNEIWQHKKFPIIRYLLKRCTGLIIKKEVFNLCGKYITICLWCGSLSTPIHSLFFSS